MKSYLGIGCMSGTSMDGLDIACCEFRESDDRYEFGLVQVGHIPFDEKWYTRLFNLMEQPAEIYAKTHVYFGHWLGESLKAFIDQFELKPDFVAAHGQTIFHQPDKNFTAQIGDGETIVTYLPCPLVTNFRNKDVALGGEGAPLITLAEKYLFPDRKLFMNLGGFCNISWGELAFDVAPANIILNYLFQAYLPESGLAYDDEGKTAAGGHFSQKLFDELNALPYYQQKPPKSLGWEWAQEIILPLLNNHELTFPDLMHTFTLHVARQVKLAIESLGVSDETILVTGGGRHNRFLIDCIQQELSSLKVEVDNSVSDELVDYKEAIGFAFLGLRTLTGKTTTLDTVTGASESSVTGSIHLPPAGGWALLGTAH